MFSAFNEVRKPLNKLSRPADNPFEGLRTQGFLQPAVEEDSVSKASRAPDATLQCTIGDYFAPTRLKLKV
jgi:hypothetical protein